VSNRSTVRCEDANPIQARLGSAPATPQVSVHVDAYAIGQAMACIDEFPALAELVLVIDAVCDDAAWASSRLDQVEDFLVG
jgi:hypothetical protein